MDQQREWGEKKTVTKTASPVSISECFSLFLLFPFPIFQLSLRFHDLKRVSKSTPYKYKWAGILNDITDNECRESQVIAWINILVRI